MALPKLSKAVKSVGDVARATPGGIKDTFSQAVGSLVSNVTQPLAPYRPLTLLDKASDNLGFGPFKRNIIKRFNDIHLKEEYEKAEKEKFNRKGHSGGDSELSNELLKEIAGTIKNSLTVQNYQTGVLKHIDSSLESVLQSFAGFEKHFSVIEDILKQNKAATIRNIDINDNDNKKATSARNFFNNFSLGAAVNNNEKPLGERMVEEEIEPHIDGDKKDEHDDKSKFLSGIITGMVDTYIIGIIKKMVSSTFGVIFRKIENVVIRQIPNIVEQVAKPLIAQLLTKALPLTLPLLLSGDTDKKATSDGFWPGWKPDNGPAPKPYHGKTQTFSEMVHDLPKFFKHHVLPSWLGGKPEEDPNLSKDDKQIKTLEDTNKTLAGKIKSMETESVTTPFPNLAKALIGEMEKLQDEYNKNLHDIEELKRRKNLLPQVAPKPLDKLLPLYDINKIIPQPSNGLAFNNATIEHQQESKRNDNQEPVVINNTQAPVIMPTAPVQGNADLSIPLATYVTPADRFFLGN